MTWPQPAPATAVNRDQTALVAGLRSGEPAAAQRLSAAYQTALVRFCWGYLGNLDDAEDAVQDIFLKVHRVGAVPDNLRPWLYRLARNHCLNLQRSRRRRRDRAALPSASHLAGTATGHLTGLLRAEQRSRLGHLLAALPEAYQEVLRLRYVEGLARGEIAEVLEVPELVIKSRLYEGLARLRRHRAILE